MSLRKEIQEAIVDMQSHYEDAERLFRNYPLELDALAELYDKISSRADDIQSYTGQLANNIYDAQEAHDRAIEAANERDQILEGVTG